MVLSQILGNTVCVLILAGFIFSGINALLGALIHDYANISTFTTEFSLRIF